MFIFLVYWVCVLVSLFFFFFFKQKTAYEMRISDWSSDVCSSDLTAFRKSAVQEFGHRLDALLRAMITVTEIAPDGRVSLVRSLGDPRFEQVFYGWYWPVADPPGRLILSRSLWDSPLPVPVAGAEASRETTCPKDGPDRQRVG